MRVAVLVGLVIIGSPAYAGGFGPWSFGMSAEQIQSIGPSGPYKSFSNGDLETYNGDFGGKKENVQFFLKDKKLWCIGIYTYEGTDIAAATRAWMHTYSTLQSQFGPLETPNYSGASLEALAESARTIVASGGKAQMAPLTQPGGEFVFCSFASYDSGGVAYYRITVSYDPPPP